MGARVLGISCVTNLAAGLGGKLSHEEVKETAGRVEQTFLRLLTAHRGAPAGGRDRAAPGHPGPDLGPPGRGGAGRASPGVRTLLALQGGRGPAQPTTAQVFSGCNVENASYGLCLCAERSAACAAVSAGQRSFRALAIATSTSPPSPPCGACRQFLAEFCVDLPLLLCNPAGERRTARLASLLPAAFRWKGAGT